MLGNDAHMTSVLAVVAAADPSLITIGGLPLHPLAVHAVVVLLPISILGLMAIIVKPTWRANHRWLVLAGLAAGTAATVAAVKGGEQLALITGITEEHRKLGELLQYDAMALFVFAAAWTWLQRGREQRNGAAMLGKGPEVIAALGSLALGVAALVLSALVGHSGANAVWASKIAAAPTPAPTTSAPVGGYTAAAVTQHNTPSACWSIIDKNVYDLTDWINKHPGGAGVIESICGIDGSAAFSGQHAGQQRAADFLAGYKLGALSGAAATPTQPINELTLAGVQTHNTAAACWTIVDGNIYNLTSWINRHPGGPGVIQGMCGIDASAAFANQHSGQGEPNQALSSYLLGAVKG